MNQLAITYSFHQFPDRHSTGALRKSCFFLRTGMFSDNSCDSDIFTSVIFGTSGMVKTRCIEHSHLVIHHSPTIGIECFESKGRVNPCHLVEQSLSLLPQSTCSTMAQIATFGVNGPPHVPYETSKVLPVDLLNRSGCFPRIINNLQQSRPKSCWLLPCWWSKTSTQAPAKQLANFQRLVTRKSFDSKAGCRFS